MATGFHGIHVIIGTSFLLVCLIRHLNNHFSCIHHFGFEAAAWYWHFVDVVWLFLYISIYWWGSYLYSIINILDFQSKDLIKKISLSNYNNILYSINHFFNYHNYNNSSFHFIKKNFHRSGKKKSFWMWVWPKKISTITFLTTIFFNCCYFFNFWCRNYSSYPINSHFKNF